METVDECGENKTIELVAWGEQVQSANYRFRFSELDANEHMRTVDGIFIVESNVSKLSLNVRM